MRGTWKFFVIFIFLGDRRLPDALDDQLLARGLILAREIVSEILNLLHWRFPKSEKSLKIGELKKKMRSH